MRTLHHRILLLLLLGAGLRVLPGQTPPPPAPIDVSLNILVSAGTSTASNAELADLQGGAHDPRQRGFTLQQAELAAAGRVADGIDGRASLIASIDAVDSETIVELEEAFVTFSQLPFGLACEAGTFFTDFGRSNVLHPHDRDWLDQAVIHTRLFGGDGMRGPGMRLRFGEPEAQRWRFSLGVQNGNGETMTSFLASDETYAERAIGGRQFAALDVRSLGDLVWTARAASQHELTVDHTLALGASLAFGPNATGPNAHTLLYGADFAVQWQGDHEGHRHTWLCVEGEVVVRSFAAAAQQDSSVPSAPITIPGATLDDVGGLLQVLGEIAPRWQAGLRGEWARGSGGSYDLTSQTFARSADSYRSDRVRISPLLTFAPSEATRVRLQYNYDEADHLTGGEHSIWLGFEVKLGAHAEH